MLRKSYAAAVQFQSQISSIKNFQELKKLANDLDVLVLVEVSSSNVWSCVIDLGNEKISGILEVWVQIKIKFGSYSFQKRSQSVRLELPLQVGFQTCERKFLEIVKESVLSISICS